MWIKTDYISWPAWECRWSHRRDGDVALAVRVLGFNCCPHYPDKHKVIGWMDGWVDGSSGKDFCRMYHLYTLLQYLTSVPPKNLYWWIIGMPAVSRLLAQSNLQPLRLVHTSLKSKKKHNSRWFILATSCLLQVPLVDRKMMVNKLWALMLVPYIIGF